jgi:hypothetical protein
MKKLNVKIKREQTHSLVWFTLALGIIPFVVSFGLIQLTIKFGKAPPLGLYLSLISGLIWIVVELIFLYLLSSFSPVRALQLRKKLILFTYLLTKQVENAELLFSVEWHYERTGDKIIIELYANGLISDKANLGKQLSEFLRLDLLRFEEQTNKAVYTFGKTPERLNGLEVLLDGL